MKRKLTQQSIKDNCKLSFVVITRLYYCVYDLFNLLKNLIEGALKCKNNMLRPFTITTLIIILAD